MSTSVTRSIFPDNAPPPFNASFHRERRAALARTIPINSAVVIVGGALQIRNGDNEHHYRPGNNLFYISGFEEADSIGIVEKDEKNVHKFTLIVPPREPSKEIWTGRRAGVVGALRDFGVDKAVESSQMKRILTLVKVCADQVFFVPSDTNLTLNDEVSKILEKTQLMSLIQMRLVKTEEELAIMRRAIEITAEGYKSMMRRWPEGTNEGEIQAIHEYEMRKRGAVRVAFPTIVASGNNATTLHYERNSSNIKAGDLIVVDSGAEYGNYSADITRTWPASGRFSEEQRALYEIVFAAQEAVLQITKPGATINVMQEVSIRVIEQGLRKLHILSGDSKPEDVKRFYPHSIGHHLGLDVHDGYDLGPQGLDAIKEQRLEPNNVLTNEPGIYIAADDLTVEPKWRGIGIRIEDDILITETGYINLTAMVPRHIDAIEAMLAGL